MVHSWSNICHLGCQSAVLIAIRAALTMLDRSLRERHVLKNNIDAFPQPTIQPTKCDVLYDLRSVWQSPHVCQVVVIPNPAVLSRQRSRVRVSSSPPFSTSRFKSASNPPRYLFVTMRGNIPSVPRFFWAEGIFQRFQYARGTELIIPVDSETHKERCLHYPAFFLNVNVFVIINMCANPCVGVACAVKSAGVMAAEGSHRRCPIFQATACLSSS